LSAFTSSLARAVENCIPILLFFSSRFKTCMYVQKKKGISSWFLILWLSCRKWITILHDNLKFELPSNQIYFEMVQLTFVFSYIKASCQHILMPWNLGSKIWHWT
jgi:hypothetical protein